MLIFMLITMILVVNYDLEKRANIERCQETKDMLDSEFHEDFIQWGAILEEDLTIRFTNQRVLFKTQSSRITPEFSSMLSMFFPRYMKIIQDLGEKFGEKEVLSIRIEGHTSSEYDNPGNDSPYIKNMELSQDRAREILQYVLSPDLVLQLFDYSHAVHRLVTANGLSSSRLICSDGKENREASRRVEFKLLTHSCQKAGIYDKVASLKGSCLGAGDDHGRD